MAELAEANTPTPPKEPVPFQPPVYQYTVADRMLAPVRGIVRLFREEKTPMWASLFALLLAVWPGFVEWRQRGTWGEYDPTIAVLTATLIALVWTAHYTFRAVRHAKQAEERAEARRRHKRMAIAAAVETELYYLHLSLEVVRVRIETRSVRVLERPQLQQALENLDLFSVDTASKLTEFDSVLQHIESHALLYAADHEAAEHAAATHRMGVVGVPLLNRNPTWVEDIRKMVGGAQSMIPLLKRLLLAEL